MGAAAPPSSAVSPGAQAWRPAHLRGAFLAKSRPIVFDMAASLCLRRQGQSQTSRSHAHGRHMIQTGDNHVRRAVLSKASSYKELEEGGTQDPDGGG